VELPLDLIQGNTNTKKKDLYDGTSKTRTAATGIFDRYRSQYCVSLRLKLFDRKTVEHVMGDEIFAVKVDSPNAIKV
jgi:hypothetical protein